MMIPEHNTDQLFTRLKELKTQPSPGVWKGIEKELDKKKKRLVPLFLRIGAAASVVIAAGLFWLFNESDSRVDSGSLVVSEQQVESDPNDAGGVTKQTKRDSSVGGNDSDILPASGSDMPVLAEKSEIRQEGTLQTASVSGDIKVAGSTGSIPDAQNLSAPQTATTEKMMPLIGDHIFDGVNISPPDRLYATQNHEETFVVTTYNDSEEKPASGHLIIGGEYSPTYSFRNVSGSAPGSVDENGLKAAGGGLALAMNVNTRWQIETGVRYATMGQEVTTTVRSERVYSITMDTYSGGSLDNSINEISLANSMGTVRTDLSPVASNDFAGFQKAPTGYVELKSNLMESSDSPVLEQSLGYLQIPVTVRYLLTPESTIGVFLSGGFSTNWLVDNDAYLQRSGQKQRIGETSGLSDVGFSTHAGVAFSVPVFKGLRFRMEPRIDYFISDIGKDTPGDYRPYSFGVFTGVFYEW